jgi:5'-nucleotidase
MSCETSTWLRVIQINDVYELGNLPRLKTLVNECSGPRAADGKTPHATLVICSGDFVAPSLLSSLDEGRAMVDCLNECGVTHVCLGNHEADISLAALRDRIEQSRFVWINSNLKTKPREDREARSPSSSFPDDLPEYCVISIGGVDSPSGGVNNQPPYTVVLFGLLTDDPSLYRPNAFGGTDSVEIIPISKRTEQLLQEFYGSVDTENHPDLILPLTHQSVQDDRIFAQAFGHYFPVVCGGHDHEVYNECIIPGEPLASVKPLHCYETCCIVKAGMDAESAGVIDFVWNGSERNDNIPQITVEIVPTSNFEPDPDLLLRVGKHQSMLQELEQAKLFRISDWLASSGSVDDCPPFSTMNNRFQSSTGTTALCTMLQMGLRSTCCVVNAGAVRGSKTYDSTSYFTWADLKNEIPFSTDMTVCSIPGSVLEAMIQNSRKGSYHNPPIASGGYLHTCRNVEILENSGDETLRIESIAGVPFERNTSYLTALPMQFFDGIDNHVPLLEWVVACDKPPFSSDEATVPAKMVLVQVFAATMWLQMGSFEEIDVNHDGVISRDEVRARLLSVCGHSEHVADLIVDNVFSICDLDDDGSISRTEMMICQYVATDMLKHVGTKDEIRIIKSIVVNVLGDSIANVSCYQDVSRLVEEIRSTIDVRGDGSINREEISQIFKGNIQRGNDLLQ